jgi:hypothetical protein
METTALGRMEHKVVHWRLAPSGAWYGWEVDDPAPPGAPGMGYHGPAGPSGPGWSDGPTVAELEQAKAAGRRAMAAGYGLPTRPDGRVGCGHCVKCDGDRPDLCHQPQGKAEARLRFQQAAADVVDAADADAAEIQRTIWREENRRRMSF